MVARCDHGGMTTADDRAAIEQLLAHYAIACDRRDFEAVADCFTPDGAATYAGERVGPGRQAFVDYLRPLLDIPMTQHLVGSVSVILDGDTATATSYAAVHVVRPAAAGGHEVVHRGLSYDDRLVRTADGWRFAERVHRVLWSTTEPTEWPVPAYR